MEHKIAHAKDLLLSQSGIEIHDLNKILNSMMSHGVDYADLYFQYTKSEYWGLEEGQVKSGSFSIDQGVGVRAVNKDKSAFAYSDDISIEALLSSSNIAKAIASKNVHATATAPERLPRGSGVITGFLNKGYIESVRKSLPALKHRTIK